MKTYLELQKLPTFKERLNYLRVKQKVAEPTFDSHRYLNQILYHSDEWRRVRQEVILRDCGCDLGIEGLDVNSRIYIHHINPITLDDVRNRNPIIFDLNNLISCSKETHDAIHYGSDIVLEQLYSSLTTRKENDTCPWKQ